MRIPWHHKAYIQVRVLLCCARAAYVFIRKINYTGLEYGDEVRLRHTIKVVIGGPKQGIQFSQGVGRSDEVAA